MTDHSFDGRSSAGLVEVYDGNLGISVVPVFISNCNPINPSFGDASSRNMFTEMRKIYLKGPASSPPSLTHYTKNYVCSNTTGRFDNNVLWVGSSDKMNTCLADTHTMLGVGEATSLARKSSDKILPEILKGNKSIAIAYRIS